MRLGCAPVEMGGCVIGLHGQHCVFDSRDVVGNDAGWLRVSYRSCHDGCDALLATQ